MDVAEEVAEVEVAMVVAGAEADVLGTERVAAGTVNVCESRKILLFVVAAWVDVSVDALATLAALAAADNVVA